MLTSLHSGELNPENLEVLKKSNEFFVKGIVENIKRKLSNEILDKFEEDLSPYLIFINLTKSYLDVLNSTNFHTQSNKNDKKINIFTQFWQVIDWVLKQASKKQKVLWVDFHSNCSNNHKSYSSNFDFKIEFDNNRPMLSTISNLKNSDDFINFLIKKEHFEILFQNRIDINSDFSIDNSFLSNLLKKNEFVFYLKIEINSKIIDNNLKINSLINDITKLLIKS